MNFRAQGDMSLQLRGGGIKEKALAKIRKALDGKGGPIATVIRWHSIVALLGGSTMFLAAVFGHQQFGMHDQDGKDPSTTHLARLGGLFYCALGSMEYVAQQDINEKNEVSYGKCFVGYHVPIVLTYIHDLLQMHTHTSYSLTAVIPSVFLALGAIALGTNEIE